MFTKIKADVIPSGVNSAREKEEENRDKLSIMAFYSIGWFPFDFGFHFVTDVRILILSVVTKYRSALYPPSPLQLPTVITNSTMPSNERFSLVASEIVGYVVNYA